MSALHSIARASAKIIFQPPERAVTCLLGGSLGNVILSKAHTLEGVDHSLAVFLTVFVVHDRNLRIQEHVVNNHHLHCCSLNVVLQVHSLELIRRWESVKLSIGNRSQQG